MNGKAEAAELGPALDRAVASLAEPFPEDEEELAAIAAEALALLEAWHAERGGRPLCLGDLIPTEEQLNADPELEAAFAGVPLPPRPMLKPRLLVLLRPRRPRRREPRARRVRRLRVRSGSRGDPPPDEPPDREADDDEPRRHLSAPGSATPPVSLLAQHRRWEREGAFAWLRARTDREGRSVEAAAA